jgi:hypothetical protein
MPRPIDRRFRLARLLASGELPDFAHDWADDLVRQAADVLRGGQPADATITAALNLRAGPLLDRAEVEARLLAEQEPADVAAAMGLPATVVDDYAKLFFDLTGQSQARSWVLHEGIGSKAFYGLTPDDVDVIMKLIGFRYGLGVLEPAVRYYRRGLHLVADLDGVPDLDAEEKAWARSIRFWVAVRTLNDPVAILKLSTTFPETRREPAASTGLHFRLTLDLAAEAVARAAHVSRSAPQTVDTTAPIAPKPPQKPTLRHTATAVRRRTSTRGGRAAVGALLAAGA